MIKKIKNTFFKLFSWGSITRCTLDPLLKQTFKKLQPGEVLDIGGKNSPYRVYIPNLSYKVLDIVPENEPDICCDIHDMNVIESVSFDTVIATEVLEHCRNPFQAMSEIFRIIKSGGVCVLSTRFFHPIHADPHDYFRFSEDGLKELFKEFSKVKIMHHGNRFHVIWKCLFFWPLKYPLYFLNPLVAKIKVRKTEYPLGYVVYAIK